MRTFWTVWVEGTGGGYGHQHTTFSEAKEEAARLVTHTGKRVFVLMLVGCFTAAAPVWEAIE